MTGFNFINLPIHYTPNFLMKRRTIDYRTGEYGSAKHQTSTEENMRTTLVNLMFFLISFCF